VNSKSGSGEAGVFLLIVLLGVFSAAMISMSIDGKKDRPYMKEGAVFIDYNADENDPYLDINNEKHAVILEIKGDYVKYRKWEDGIMSTNSCKSSTFLVTYDPYKGAK
jgi:hypothetical protein